MAQLHSKVAQVWRQAIEQSDRQRVLTMCAESPRPARDTSTQAAAWEVPPLSAKSRGRRPVGSNLGAGAAAAVSVELQRAEAAGVALPGSRVVFGSVIALQSLETSRFLEICVDASDGLALRTRHQRSRDRSGAAATRDGAAAAAEPHEAEAAREAHSDSQHPFDGCLAWCSADAANPLLAPLPVGTPDTLSALQASADAPVRTDAPASRPPAEAGAASLPHLLRGCVFRIVNQADPLSRCEVQEGDAVALEVLINNATSSRWCVAARVQLNRQADPRYMRARLARVLRLTPFARAEETLAAQTTLQLARQRGRAKSGSVSGAAASAEEDEKQEAALAAGGRDGRRAGSAGVRLHRASSASVPQQQHPQQPLLQDSVGRRLQAVSISVHEDGAAHASQGSKWRATTLPLLRFPGFPGEPSTQEQMLAVAVAAFGALAHPAAVHATGPASWSKPGAGTALGQTVADEASSESGEEDAPAGGSFPAGQLDGGPSVAASYTTAEFEEDLRREPGRPAQHDAAAAGAAAPRGAAAGAARGAAVGDAAAAPEALRRYAASGGRRRLRHNAAGARGEAANSEGADVEAAARALGSWTLRLHTAGEVAGAVSAPTEASGGEWAETQEAPAAGVEAEGAAPRRKARVSILIPGSGGAGGAGAVTSASTRVAARPQSTGAAASGARAFGRLAGLVPGLTFVPREQLLPRPQSTGAVTLPAEGPPPRAELGHLAVISLGLDWGHLQAVRVQAAADIASPHDGHADPHPTEARRLGEPPAAALQGPVYEVVVAAEAITESAAAAPQQQEQQLTAAAGEPTSAGDQVSGASSDARALAFPSHAASIATGQLDASLLATGLSRDGEGVLGAAGARADARGQLHASLDATAALLRELEGGAGTARERKQAAEGTPARPRALSLSVQLPHAPPEAGMAQQDSAVGLASVLAPEDGTFLTGVGLTGSAEAAGSEAPAPAPPAPPLTDSGRSALRGFLLGHADLHGRPVTTGDSQPLLQRLHVPPALVRQTGRASLFDAPRVGAAGMWRVWLCAPSLAAFNRQQAGRRPGASASSAGAGAGEARGASRPATTSGPPLSGRPASREAAACAGSARPASSQSVRLREAWPAQGPEVRLSAVPGARTAVLGHAIGDAAAAPMIPVAVGGSGQRDEAAGGSARVWGLRGLGGVSRQALPASPSQLLPRPAGLGRPASASVSPSRSPLRSRVGEARPGSSLAAAADAFAATEDRARRQLRSLGSPQAEEQRRSGTAAVSEGMHEAQAVSLETLRGFQVLRRLRSAAAAGTSALPAEAAAGRSSGSAPAPKPVAQQQHQLPWFVGDEAREQAARLRVPAGSPAARGRPHSSVVRFGDGGANPQLPVVTPKSAASAALLTRMGLLKQQVSVPASDSQAPSPAPRAGRAASSSGRLWAGAAGSSRAGTARSSATGRSVGGADGRRAGTSRSGLAASAAAGGPGAAAQAALRRAQAEALAQTYEAAVPTACWALVERNSLYSKVAFAEAAHAQLLALLQACAGIRAREATARRRAAEKEAAASAGGAAGFSGEAASAADDAAAALAGVFTDTPHGSGRGGGARRGSGRAATSPLPSPSRRRPASASQHTRGDSAGSATVLHSPPATPRAGAGHRSGSARRGGRFSFDDSAEAAPGSRGSARRGAASPSLRSPRPGHASGAGGASSPGSSSPSLAVPPQAAKASVVLRCLRALLRRWQVRQHLSKHQKWGNLLASHGAVVQRALSHGPAGGGSDLQRSAAQRLERDHREVQQAAAAWEASAQRLLRADATTQPQRRGAQGSRLSAARAAEVTAAARGESAPAGSASPGPAVLMLHPNASVCAPLSPMTGVSLEGSDSAVPQGGGAPEAARTVHALTELSDAALGVVDADDDSEATEGRGHAEGGALDAARAPRSARALVSAKGRRQLTPLKPPAGSDDCAAAANGQMSTQQLQPAGPERASASSGDGRTQSKVPRATVAPLGAMKMSPRAAAVGSAFENPDRAVSASGGPRQPRFSALVERLASAASARAAQQSMRAQFANGRESPGAVDEADSRRQGRLLSLQRPPSGLQLARGTGRVRSALSACAPAAPGLPSTSQALPVGFGAPMRAARSLAHWGAASAGGLPSTGGGGWLPDGMPRAPGAGGEAAPAQVLRARDPALMLPAMHASSQLARLQPLREETWLGAEGAGVAARTSLALLAATRAPASALRIGDTGAKRAVGMRRDPPTGSETVPASARLLSLRNPRVYGDGGKAGSLLHAAMLAVAAEDAVGHSAV